MSKIVILGAGAIGLSLAHILTRAGQSVAVLEASPEPGGLLATLDLGGGCRLERYYHHFFTHDAELAWLLGELGLAEDAQFERGTMGMFKAGRVYPFDGPVDLLRFDAIPLAARVRFGVAAALLSYAPGFEEREDVPALAWFERWAGRRAVNAIWRPLLEVKFGEAASRIPLAWMAGRLRQRVRSRRRGQERLGYLRGSLQRLVERLVASLSERGVELRTSAPAVGLELAGGAVRGVVLAGGEVVRGDAVVSTVPSTVLGQLVTPVNAGYARALARVGYLGASCSVLELSEPLSPVYWLNVAEPGYDFGGVIEQTRLVPPAEYGGRHLVYLSRYLEPEHPLWSMDEATLKDRQLGQLEALFGRAVRPLVRRFWVFKARTAAALTDLGFHERIPAYRSPIPNLYVAAMCHIYPDERSVNNSIRVAAAVASVMGFDTRFVPHGPNLAAKYGW